MKDLVQRHPDLRILVFDIKNDLLGVSIPNGYGGWAHLRERLTSEGIPLSQFEIVPWDYERDRMLHTLVESENVVRFCKRQGWSSLLVVAPPFHLPRAAITMASVAMRELPELRVYPVPGAPLRWAEASVHSQGMKGTRLDFLDSELARISTYTAKGDLEPADALLHFFAER